MSDSPIKVRLATADDLPFIYSSWYRAHRPYQKHVANPEYADGHNARMRTLLAHSKVLVAYSRDYPDEILGYAVIEGDTVHFVYTKTSYRRMGVASGLVMGGYRYYSHWMGEQGRSFAEAVGLIYNPYRLDRERTE